MILINIAVFYAPNLCFPGSPQQWHFAEVIKFVAIIDEATTAISGLVMCTCKARFKITHGCVNYYQHTRFGSTLSEIVSV